MTAYDRAAVFNLIQDLPEGLREAACKGRGRLMFDAVRVDTAVDLCMGSCLAYTVCLEWSGRLPGDKDPGGVLAGLTEEERQARRTSKVCFTCREPLPLDKFPWRSKEQRTRRGVCQDCVNAQERERRAGATPGQVAA